MRAERLVKEISSSFTTIRVSDAQKDRLPYKYEMVSHLTYLTQWLTECPSQADVFSTERRDRAALIIRNLTKCEMGLLYGNKGVKKFEETVELETASVPEGLAKATAAAKKVA